jgi:ketosteroid isomerase-like protein
MMTESARPEAPAIALPIALRIPEGIPEGTALDPAGQTGVGDKARQRFDLANYHEQVYGDCAICSYTLLVSRGTADGVAVRTHNESRVLVRIGNEWKVVHVHKSPAWKAPYEPPS